ncbi:formyltetrahydrofolate deformylase [Streptomyces sp. NPDC057474]|uniref:formyltetrahydrofolate deformylase n=1 Tax=Streptomyces sp. NPDC057474 TaxID=3346144 RepID=UPI0036A5DA00
MTTIAQPAAATAPTSAGQADHGCLVVQGRDRPGIVAAVTALLQRHGANITALDQHSDDPSGGAFFQRTVFRLPDLAVRVPALEADLDSLTGQLDLNWELFDQAAPKRVAILASKSDHCVLDLLWRQRRGEIPMTVPMVISNHADLAADVRNFGVPFIHTPTDATNRDAVEAEHLDLLRGNVDLVVLARYMRILSPGFLEKIGVPVINIHHSFLPAFIGAAPYRRAHERGVKLVGATAHYVTEDLDEGPIIDQDVARASHRDSVAELVRRGADVERQVLSRAVLWHCQNRVVRHDKHTIVF